MKAYAIFDGGGVKGAALAGCLAAAQDKEIDIVAYGGTSAGAIVALLGSIGYKGQEILEILKTSVHPTKMLDDGGERLTRAQSFVEEAIQILRSSDSKTSKCLALRRLTKEASEILEVFSRDMGLYEGKSLRDNLIAIIWSLASNAVEERSLASRAGL